MKHFKDFDLDQDGLLNSQELAAYSSSRGLELPESTLESIISSVGSVTENTFRAAHRKLFIAHWEAIASALEAFKPPENASKRVREGQKTWFS